MSFTAMNSKRELNFQKYCVHFSQFLHSSRSDLFIYGRNRQVVLKAVHRLAANACVLPIDRRPSWTLHILVLATSVNEHAISSALFRHHSFLETFVFYAFLLDLRLQGLLWNFHIFAHVSVCPDIWRFLPRSARLRSFYGFNLNQPSVAFAQVHSLNLRWTVGMLKCMKVCV